MARPPLDEETRRERSMFILVGRAEQIEQEGDDVQMEFVIEEVEKAIMPPPSDRITVQYNRGLGDDEGQHSPVPEGVRVRLFAQADIQTGDTELLEPNGWEPA